MIAIRKEKREEAMAKKRINVGGASGGAEINPNVFHDASDSTAMTHEQRTTAKGRLVRVAHRLNERSKKREISPRRLCFFKATAA